VRKLTARTATPYRAILLGRRGTWVRLEEDREVHARAVLIVTGTQDSAAVVES
jgi:hypothetical protein